MFIFRHKFSACCRQLSQSHRYVNLLFVKFYVLFLFLSYILDRILLLLKFSHLLIIFQVQKLDSEVWMTNSQIIYSACIKVGELIKDKFS